MMKNMLKNNKCYITIAIGCLLILGVFLPVTQAISNIDYIKGFDKGPSTLPVVPLKKATFVGFDKESILDDLAYLACVPTSVLNNDGRLFSHPLLFYEDEYKYENDWERTLNARQGLDYFMEDWMSYCNNQLDQMTLVNVPVNKVDQWRADEYVEITNLGDQPQELTGCVLRDISDEYPSLIFSYYILAPGESIRVYTNEYHPEWGGFSFEYSQPIWNNIEPDVAVLYDNQGNEVSQKSY